MNAPEEQISSSHRVACSLRTHFIFLTFKANSTEPSPVLFSSLPCVASIVDNAVPALAVTARETKQLLDAHVRFGHRNFRSLAKALNMRLPAKIPFCRACVEAKSTRHPKSSVPRPLREPAPRAGYRIHFDPFGPFSERLADGSYYGLPFVDA